MRTLMLSLDPVAPAAGKISIAARTIRNGGTVAFPTETVYGIGANALDARACLKIFKAKGRPADNPLIVHIASFGQLNQVARDVPASVRRAMHSLWPGPVTFVLDKTSRVPYEVTAGLDTVAVRMPANPIALQLIKRSGVPIAAPSANRSSRPSPTSAEHVISDLKGRVDVIIDGGPALFGVESTVIDATARPYALLRPGALPVEELRHRLGRIAVAAHGAAKPKSPGMKYKHYSPRTRLIVTSSKALLLRAAELTLDKKAVVLCSNELARRLPVGIRLIPLGSERNPYELARNVFSALRALDSAHARLGLMQSFPRKGIGLALMDRIMRASGAPTVSSLQKLRSVLK